MLKKTYLLQSILFVLLAMSMMMFVPYAAFAIPDDGNSGDVGGNTGNPGGDVGGDTGNPDDNSNGSSGSGGLDNPLNSETIDGFLLAILDVLLTFAIPIIVFFIIYAGFLYVTAGGDETKVKKAHAALTWSVVGGVIVLGANLIMDVIQNTVNAL